MLNNCEAFRRIRIRCVLKAFFPHKRKKKQKTFNTCEGHRHRRRRKKNIRDG